MPALRQIQRRKSALALMAPPPVWRVSGELDGDEVEEDRCRMLR
jgi:hypothetical protein